MVPLSVAYLGTNSWASVYEAAVPPDAAEAAFLSVSLSAQREQYNSEVLWCTAALKSRLLIQLTPRRLPSIGGKILFVFDLSSFLCFQKTN